MTIYYIHIKIRCRSFSSFFEYHRRLGNQAMNFLEIKFLSMCIILPLSAKKGKKIFRHNAKRLKSFNLSLSCGRWDLNPHKRNAYKILSLARLPVPTLPRIGCFKILYLSPTHINIPHLFMFGKYFFEFFKKNIFLAIFKKLLTNPFPYTIIYLVNEIRHLTRCRSGGIGRRARFRSV